MERYSACVDAFESSIQIVITLPQSKSGYTYPEVQLRVPQKDGSLKYVSICFTNGSICKSGAETFIYDYLSAKPLTKEKFKELDIFNGTLDDVAKTLFMLFHN